MGERDLPPDQTDADVSETATDEAADPVYEADVVDERWEPL